MQALAKTAPDRGQLEVVTKPDPEPGADEVLIEVAYAGLCGSDMGIYEFEEAYDSLMEFPRVIGHEYSGFVTEIGSDVDDFDPGDLVVERPIRSCGACYQCRTGSPNVCQHTSITGVQHDGAFAELITVPASDLNRVPDELSPMSAALAEPLSVAVRAASHNAIIEAGDRVLVEGPGPIGLLSAQVADVEGADVTVSGIGRDTGTRLPFAAELALETVNVEATPIEQVVETRTDGGGFDVVIDTTGVEAGLVSAGAAVRKGGQVVLVGQTGIASLDLTPFIRGEIDLQFSYASTWADFERALRLLANGAIEIDRFIDTRFSLSRIEQAFESFGAGETCKPLFDLGELRDD
jgi:threonine dehydrogenase-like Zn-dependent dehydrogenase